MDLIATGNELYKDAEQGNVKMNRDVKFQENQDKWCKFLIGENKISEKLGLKMRLQSIDLRKCDKNGVAFVIKYALAD